MQYVISVVAGRPRPHLACEVAKQSLIEVYKEVSELLCTAGPNAKCMISILPCRLTPPHVTYALNMHAIVSVQRVIWHVIVATLSVQLEFTHSLFVDGSKEVDYGSI